MAKSRDKNSSRSYRPPKSSGRSRDRRSRSPERTDRSRRDRDRSRSRSRTRDRARDSYRPAGRSRDSHYSQSRSRSRSRDDRRSNRDNDSARAGRRGRRSRSPAKEDRTPYRKRSPLPNKDSSSQNKGRNKKPSASQNMELQANSWCFKCHKFDHWTADCTSTPGWKNGNLKFSSFKLEHFVASRPAFSFMVNQHFNSTEELISHIYYAVDRLNQYESFVIKRDGVFAHMIKDSVRDRSIPEKEKLAHLDVATPYEAYLSRSCRLTHTFVKTCWSLLRYLYTKGVLSLFDVEKENADKNKKLSFDEKYNIAAEMLLEHWTTVARDRNAGNAVTPLEIKLTPNDMTHFGTEMAKAYQEYTSKMDEALKQWKSFDSSFKLWKKRPTDPRRQALANVPFITLRVSEGDSAEATVQTAEFLKVERFEHYEDLNKPQAKNEDTDMADAKKPGSDQVEDIDQKIAKEVQKKVDELLATRLATQPVVQPLVGNAETGTNATNDAQSLQQQLEQIRRELDESRKAQETLEQQKADILKQAQDTLVQKDQEARQAQQQLEERARQALAQKDQEAREARRQLEQRAQEILAQKDQENREALAKKDRENQEALRNQQALRDQQAQQAHQAEQSRQRAEQEARQAQEARRRERARQLAEQQVRRDQADQLARRNAVLAPVSVHESAPLPTIMRASGSVTNNDQHDAIINDATQTPLPNEDDDEDMFLEGDHVPTAPNEEEDLIDYSEDETRNIT